MRCLAGLLDQPMLLADLQQAAHVAWGWSGWFTSNVVCAGEGNVLRALHVKDEWLYGRTPGVYAVPSQSYGRELRKIVASTVSAKKRTKAGKGKSYSYHAGHA